MAKLREKSDAHLGEYFEHLAAAEKDVRQAIAEFTLDPQSESPAKLARLESLKSEIDRIVDDMKARHEGLAERQTEEGFDDGIGSGVAGMRARPAPRGWGVLTDAQIATATARAATLIDRAGLEFLSAYRLELAGNVADELKSKIKSAVAGGIVRGDSISTVVQNLGRVITDPEKFRRAGQETPRGFVGRVFPSAANRLAAIVETENNRAHNQGRVAFYTDVGIGRVRWLTSGLYDCPVCSPRNGKVYKLDELPTIPAHTHCDCVVVGEPDVDDRDEMSAMKAPGDYGVVDEPDSPPTKKTGAKSRFEPKKIKHLRGVENHIKSEYGIQSVSLKDATIEVAQETARAVEEMFRRGYPMPRTISTYARKDGVLAMADHESVSLNVTSLNKMEKAIRAGKNKIDPRWFRDNSTAGTVRHEFGHVAHRQSVPVSDLKKAMKISEASPHDFIESLADGVEIENWMSKYGMTKNAEFIAETISAHTGGQPVPPAVLKVYNAVGGPPLK
ncbi:hypothetical protein K8I61_17330 [bacterium]|nr:hypothetical protein [bacterium]